MAEGLIRRSRWLPYLAEPTVRAGDVVDEDTVVARIPYLPGRVGRLEVARQLGVPPESLPRHLLVRPGEMVRAGHPLAAARHHWTWAVVSAPQDGAVAWVSRHLGYVYFREPVPLGEASRVRVDVAGPLGVPPSAVRGFLRVEVGQGVYRGQVLASRTEFGQRPASVLSPVYGRVTEVDASSGEVELAPVHAPTETRAYIRGTVVRADGEAVEIAGWGHVFWGAWGVGGETWGRLEVPPGGPDAVLTEEQVGPEHQGAIVAGAATATVGALERLRQVGARGLFVAYLELEALRELAGASLLSGGRGEPPFTVVLRYGFRPCRMSRGVYDLLASLTGSVVSLDGTTQVRAGTKRPELVAITDPTRTQGQPVELPGRPQPGDRVVLLTPRHFGAKGTVQEVLEGGRATLPSRVTVKTARVRLERRRGAVDGGSAVENEPELLVPYDNLYPEE